MKILCLFIFSVCGFITFSQAMEKGDLLLSQLASTDIKNIAVTNPMAGDLNMQRMTVKSFAQKLPEVIIADGQGNFEVNMQEFKGLCASTAITLNPNESVGLVQFKAVSAGSEGMRLFNTLSGKGKVGAVFGAVGSIFIFGMIAGWFYTTKAHAAPHGASS